ncbi:MAG: dihydrofolate reductase [Saprospiraceae bacterium]
MMNWRHFYCLSLVFVLLASCQETATDTKDVTAKTAETFLTEAQLAAKVNDADGFVWNPESFADLKIIRYQIPGFDKLSLQQQSLVYYLTQAGLCGREIMYDQNYRHNLTIKRAMENIVKNYQGDRATKDWNNFMTYVKRMWFSSGIHHHYGNDKFIPEFSKEYFKSIADATKTTVSAEIMDVIFNPAIDAKKINFDPEKDLIKASAVNFYDPDLTEAEVDAFYKKLVDPKDERPISYSLNSKIVKNEDGSLSEKVWHADGMYGAAIKEIIKWLEKAVTVAENEPQKKALQLLIKYYQTGDLKVWDEYNIAWVSATDGDVDYINSFIEVYQDPKGYKGSYESIVQIKDFDASARMQVVAQNAQWFEDHSPIMDAHRKKNVVGVSYKVVTVAGEAGDASPSTPIGVNLPNANWIRATYGSKSVSLGNIIQAYSNADGPGMLGEFAHDDEEKARAKKHGKLSSKMHTALHEVVGHASGQLEKDVATPKQTLKNYASPLEEARADLVGLYYIADPKLVELGLVESDEVGKAQYDSYIRNGLMLQLRRIEPGKTVQQAHMRNRQMVAAWVFEKGAKDGVIEKVSRDGNTYFDVKDYAKLRTLFGELLKEVQRIKSQGDYEAGKALIETYGVQVDQAIHKEVLARSEKLNIPPYGGFINPEIVPETDSEGKITSFKLVFPKTLHEQMMKYAEKYAFLPAYN